MIKFNNNNFIHKKRYPAPPPPYKDVYGLFIFVFLALNLLFTLFVLSGVPASLWSGSILTGLPMAVVIDYRKTCSIGDFTRTTIDLLMASSTLFLIVCTLSFLFRCALTCASNSTKASSSDCIERICWLRI
jgi:hypothetical protein